MSISPSRKNAFLREARGIRVPGEDVIANHDVRTTIDSNPSTIAVLTGDGAGKQLGEGFLSDLKRIKEKFSYGMLKKRQ